MEKAIKKACDVGYDVSKKLEYGESRLLDPLFWQALGKARGTEGDEVGDGMGGWIPEWKYWWHKFIDHLAEGKDLESFFNELLK